MSLQDSVLRSASAPGTSAGAKRAAAPSAICPLLSALRRPGLTLAELLIVVAVLAVLGSLVLPAVGRYMAEARGDLTRQSLTRLRDVIAETYWQDLGRLPRPNDSVTPNYPQLRYLFVNPNRNPEDATVDYDPAYRRGWRGPYVVHRPGAAYTVNDTANFTNRYGLTNDPAVLDGWGNPIVIQQYPTLLADGCWDVRLVSAGPNGVLEIDPTAPSSSLNPADVDDVWISFEVRP